MPQTTYYNTQAFPFYNPSINNGLMKNCNSNRNGGKIALAPQTDPIILQLKTVLQSFGHDVQLFADNQAIDDFTQLDNYGSGNQRLCFGVVMQENNLNGKYQYTLRYNTSQLTGWEDIPSTNNDRISTINQDEITTLQRYAASGFLTVQNWLDNLILRKQTNNPSAQITATGSSVKVPAYKNDDLLPVLKGVIQYLVVVPLLLPFLRLTDGVLREKERRIREGMKIMGLEGTTFYLSWFILYAGVMTLISIATTSILKFGFFVNSSFGFLFLWYWEYAVCSVSLGILVTVFFNKAKIGNIAGFVFLFMLQWVGQLVANDDVSETARFWASIAPPISISLAGNQLLSLEASQLGLTSETMNTLYFSYRTVYHYMWMAIGTVVFLLISLYLDQILPSEFGIRKHPFFLCIKKKRKLNPPPTMKQEKLETEEALNNDVESVPLNENFEDVDPVLKTQDERGESIIISNLYKKYKNGKVAVKNVNYNMYSGQIFALLGHNGAGKTSTISMLTGLYPATEGTISIFGMDIERDLESIRKIMGVCPQHDVLFEDLTVKEHLELFATFKGVDPKTAPFEIEKLINDLDLYEKRNERSKNLSGGQKRRLSVAIAFLGGSKFILLDEPSSGMDTSARRRLWDMLKNYKHGRVIVLTTHFMDEADYLGDRIGIMGDGQMQCLGSTLFLKNRFGVGYTLTVSKKDATQSSQNVISLIQSHIQEAKIVSHVSSEIILQLPMDTVFKFKSLFDDLDSQLNELNIESYGISVTTLEQVFLNVANLLKDPKKPRAKILANPQTDEFANFDLRKERIPSAFKVFAHQFYALIKKRLLCFKRDRMSIALELFLPIIMIIIGVALIKVNTVAPPKTLYLSDNLYGAPFDVRYNTILPGGSSLDPDIITTLNSDDAYNFIGVPVNTMANFDTQVFENRKDDPISIFNVFFNSLDNTGKSFNYFTEVDTRAQEAGPYALNKINNALLKYATNDANNEIELFIIPFMNAKNYDTIKNSLDGLGISFIFAIGMSFIPASLITFIVKERESTVKHQQLVSGISLQAYWFANYFVDMIKYMIPAVINCFMAVAFKAQGLIQGEKYNVLWALFMSYGFSVISFVYLTSFFFEDYSVAQTITFFFHFGTGFIGGLAVGMLRMFTLTNKIARIEQWFFRPFPTFSLTYGLLELTNQEIYQKVEKDPVLRSPWELDLSGGDVLYMAVTAFVFFMLVFVVEFFKAKKIFSKRIPKAIIPKNPVYLDDDVEEEAKRIESSSKNGYSVKIDKLCKVYKTSSGKFKTATNQISFGVKNGECFALLGVNGAGKTTTFKMLSGDVRPTSGQAVINGYDIPSEIRQAQHDIGYCPQNDPLLEYLTAREHLYLFAAIRGIPTLLRKKIIEKILQDVNLTEYADVVSGAYSGGNKRKLCVAIAMIGNPPIIFLDEPSSGMDPEARRFMWEAISRISKERQRSSVILTTHSMEEAEALSTRMCIMVNGVMRCLGNTQHIKTKYGGGYEMEVKLHLIKKSEIVDSIKAMGFEQNHFLARDQVYRVLETYGVADLASQISEEGTGSPVHMEIIKKDQVSIHLVLDWILTEKRGQLLKDFLVENFNNVVLIEHFQSFYRFNIKSEISIGQIFGKIEENKLGLNIMQYSVRQSTIEQIFNTFATTQENPIVQPPPKKFKSNNAKIWDRPIPDEFVLEMGAIKNKPSEPITQLELP